MGPERRLRLFIYARIIVSFLFLASTVLLDYKDTASPGESFHSGVVRLMAFSFLFSCLSHIALRFRRFIVFTIYLQSIWDVLFVTLLLLFTDGIGSPYSFIYLLSIMNAGVLLGRRDALYTAALCGILYGAMVDLQYFGLLEPIGLSQAAARSYSASSIFYTIFLNLMGFGLTAFITGYLADRLRSSEEALRENLVNYEELALLNTKIVTNIETGLMTTNRQGRIRVFNPYAEHLTGRTQEEVYDTPFSSLFPELVEGIDTLEVEVRGEFEYLTRDGLRLILGFHLAPFDGTGEDNRSVIVNFRDITGIRRMEEALKRADRLAALGELSARMAHEIRNPLAAMSGSVQMLAEQGSIGDNDGRLMAIVLRESERLNKLITEFLAYARPSAPQKVPIDLSTMAEDLRLLLKADSRFTAIEIINQVPAYITLQADRHQFSQVLINLLQNSADAMPEGGRITIDADFLLSGADGFRKSPVVRLSVTDSGKGLDPEASRHIFEPFWTTKAEGTGLGLAIIYRIIEAHGGMVSAESPPSGGCRIIILMPV
jgi:two-component system sensor histidine kinase PilS (NtrC family)